MKPKVICPTRSEPPPLPHPSSTHQPPLHHRLLSFLFFLSCFCFFCWRPSCAPSRVRAAATAPKCIGLSRPRSPTPTGWRYGGAGTHTRWFTPAPIAKSRLRAVATANGDVEGHGPSGHTLRSAPLKGRRSRLTSCVKVLVQVRTNPPGPFSVGRVGPRGVYATYSMFWLCQFLKVTRVGLTCFGAASFHNSVLKWTTSILTGESCD